MAKRDYYELLGIDKGASESQIKAAYRKKALEYHPDRNSDPKAEEVFKECAEAYEVLSNREKRTLYDQYGHQGVSGQGFQSAEDVFSSFGDIFESFFGGESPFGSSRGRRASSRNNGADLEYNLHIDLKDAVFGVQKKIEYQCQTTCTRCKGTRAKEGSTAKTCSSCGGAGQVRRSQGFFSMVTTCPNCAGEGTVIRSPCPRCRGKGRIMDKKIITVKIPSGVDTGVRLRIGGGGEGGISGGNNGDLYVALHIRKSRRYQRQELDLIVREEVDIVQAALGCKLQIETLRGSETIQVPAGIQHGQSMRIPRQGVPALSSPKIGDLIVEIRVIVPRKLKREQRELLEKFAAISEEGAHKKKDNFFHRILN